MIWAGRLNAILLLGVCGTVGAMWFLTMLLGALDGFPAVMMILAVVLGFAIRLGAGLVDLWWRAVKGRPFLYQTRLEMESGQVGKVS